MSVYFKTSDPAKLLRAIKKDIDDGRIKTWSYDKDGDFTHTPNDWKNRAWLRPMEENGRLRFRIIRNKDSGLPREVYAVYHGRFIEMAISHEYKLFTEACATPNPMTDDGDIDA